MHWQIQVKVKVKEVDLYSAFFVVPHTQGAQHSPDGASPDGGCRYLIAGYYSFICPERIKG